MPRMDSQRRWPKVGFEEIAINLLQARLNEAFAADAFACPWRQCAYERIRLGHKEITYDPVIRQKIEHPQYQ
jgi:hypothetical protein